MDNDLIHNIRHSLAHLLAMAVLERDPQAKPTIGPIIDDGFYYDFELNKPISETDLPALEQRVRELVKQNLKFEQTLAPDKATARQQVTGNSYKEQLIDELPEGEPITFYTSGNFTDLCRGSHVASTKEIDPAAFCLDRIAGAYWRGNEKNKMLTRIYGLAFSSAPELTDYKKMREEQAKRDHRTLGQALQLFTFSEEIGAGLPVWLPRGTVLRDELENLAKEEEFALGYERVSTPIITKEALFIKSGHLPHYRESMYAPMDIDGESYFIKPMNCPFHHVVYQSQPRSYRDLPIRLAEYGLCHRYEKSGELQGLMRVRSMWMNDAHIYVRPDQVKDEMKAVIGLHQRYYELFGITKVRYRLSLHDPKDLGGKYVNEPAAWKANEQILREVLQEMGVDFYEAENEASFYGPKIDINIFSAIGKEYTLGTAQLDFAQPHSFGLTYADSDGKEKMPYVIHRAPLSVHERFIGFLIEHFAGAFPLWLAPVQVQVASVSEAHAEFAASLVSQLRTKRIRAVLDDSNETVGKKIRGAEVMKTPYTVVVGDKEMTGNDLAIRVRGQKELWTSPTEEFIAKIINSIQRRSLKL